MSQICLLFFSVLFYVISLGVSIKNGESVGRIQEVSGKSEIIYKDLYPHMVHIVISHILKGKRASNFCGGVILGRKAILTAGHCLHDTVQPMVTVHAGVLDVNFEKHGGQKIKVKEFLVHPEYKAECRVDRIRCCYDINDIAILWLEELLDFDDFISSAKLNKNIQKPVNQKGWILGWGLDNSNKLSSMLQRGEVVVISREECDRFNPTVHVTNQVLCLKPGSKGAKSAEADSGGPFEINGVVYGISSHSLFKNPESCWSDEVNVYTDVAHYHNWISNNLQAGPPNERPKIQQKVTTKRPPSPHGKFPNQRPSSSQGQRNKRH